MLEQRMEQLKTVKKNAMQADVKALKERTHFLLLFLNILQLLCQFVQIGHGNCRTGACDL